MANGCAPWPGPVPAPGASKGGDRRLRSNKGRVAEIQEAIDRATGRTGRRRAHGGIGRPRRLRQRKTGEENGSKEENSR